MKIITEKNILLHNSETKAFLADAFYPENAEALPLVIFVHGYKGYKDWGAWNLMAESFAKNGFFFVKFNFSHNGTSIENPSEFADLEAFSENNYTKELSDLEIVIHHFSENKKVNSEHITLIGHSRGGGISIIKASENHKIKNLITLASVDTLDRFPKGEKLEEWKKEGIYSNYNSRTKQQMPHKIQFLEDFEKNKNRFGVEKAMKNFAGKSLIIHGKEDEAVDFSAAENLHFWAKNAESILMEKANHTFGSKEPWTDYKMPILLNKVVKSAIEFLQRT